MLTRRKRSIILTLSIFFAFVLVCMTGCKSAQPADTTEEMTVPESGETAPMETGEAGQPEDAETGETADSGKEIPFGVDPVEETEPSSYEVTEGETLSEKKAAREASLETPEEAQRRLQEEIQRNTGPWPEEVKSSDRLPTAESIKAERRKVGHKLTGGILTKAPGERRNIDLEKYEDPPADPAPEVTPPDKYKDMVKIDGAEIEMGMNLTRGNSAADYDTPGHKVQVNDFYIDKYEVTNAEYRKFVEATGHRKPSHWLFGDIPEGKEDHPVTKVSWEDAVAYCEWAGKRLPTEAEWELAARTASGKANHYPWGPHFDASICNVRESKVGDTVPARPSEDSPYYKGASKNNVYHMAGNVMEWCQDNYTRYTGNTFSTHDKYLKPSKLGRYKVLRGGSYFHSHDYALTYARFFDKKENWFCSYYGFRCAMDAN